MPTLPVAHDTLMYHEAHEAADAVDRQLHHNTAILESLATRLRAWPPRFIVTGARGSSDHAATFAKYVFETQLGVMTASGSPSVSSVYHSEQNLEDALYIAISQSGKSPDLLRHAAAAKRAGAYIVALVNVEDSPLAAMADTLVPLRAGPEKSVAATKSYICSLSAIVHLAALWKRDQALRDALFAVPQALRDAWPMDWSSLVNGLAGARNLFVVGRGLGLAAAQEAALKLKETCGLHAEAFSAAEVKHGPMALVGPGFPVLFFVQDDDTSAGTIELAREFRARGAPVWIAAPGDGPETTLPLGANLHPVVTPLITIASFYRAANALALARGRNPDVPPHLAKVTETV